MSFSPRHSDNLAVRARDLSTTLKKITFALEEYLGKKPDCVPCREWVNRLRPLVGEFDDVVNTHGSREHASRLLTEIGKVMSEVNSAVSGWCEIPILDSMELNKYWELHTIFREARYRDQYL